MGVYAALVEGSGGQGVSRMVGCGVCTLFGVVIVLGEAVLSCLLVDVVVVAGGRFLGSGRGGECG